MRTKRSQRKILREGINKKFSRRKKRGRLLQRKKSLLELTLGKETGRPDVVSPPTRGVEKNVGVEKGGGKCFMDSNTKKEKVQRKIKDTR